MIDKRKREYCGRENTTGKNFHEIGPLLRYEQLLEADTYLQKLETKYNKIYSRFYRAEGKLDSERSFKDLTREEFRVW